MRDAIDESNADEARRGPGFNRRDFLKGSGVAVAATAVAASVDETHAQKIEAVKKGPANVALDKPTSLKLEINGHVHQVTVRPRVMLLDVLRDDLNLTGAKDVCDTTNCGACTVIIDGKPVYACARTAIECVGKKITTVEGLGDGKNVDDVIKCFIKHDATQCGYCTPGFVVATRVLLNSKPGAGIEEIRKGLGGNICRCGTYDGLAKAALECASAGNKGGR